MRLSRKWTFIVIAVLAPFGLYGFAWVFGQIVMRLWNWLLPTLFGLPEITMWQGFGLLVLCRILFGGFGSGGGPSPKRRRGDGKFREAACERWSRSKTEGGAEPAA